MVGLACNDEWVYRAVAVFNRMGVRISRVVAGRENSDMNEEVEYILNVVAWGWIDDNDDYILTDLVDVSCVHSDLAIRVIKSNSSWSSVRIVGSPEIIAEIVRINALAVREVRRKVVSVCGVSPSIVDNVGSSVVRFAGASVAGRVVGVGLIEAVGKAVSICVLRYKVFPTRRRPVG